MKQTIALLLLFGLFINNSMAQTKSVSGKVTDDKGATIPGVNVVVKGTLKGTITNVDGLFSINVTPSDTLVFSFVGLQTQYLPVGSHNSFTVMMKPENKTLNDVVVVGYGVQKKSNISGSITSVDSKELHSMATNDVGQALQGKAPVFAVKNSGKPGESTSIFLRGVGSMNNSGPLWIIDGVQGAPLENFDNVESIQILKDAASAAIYGVQAANGVILVTTKKAQKGKVSVNYHGYVKINNTLGLPKLLGTQDYIDMYLNRWKSDNPGASDSTMHENVKPFYFMTPSEVNQLPSTDWVGQMFKQGTDQVHSVSVSGGNEKYTYFFSGLHEDDGGTLVNTNYKKSSFRLQFGQKPTNWLKLNETIVYTYSKRRLFYDYNKLWQGIFRGNPAMKVYDSTNPMGTGYGYFDADFASKIDWQGGNPLEDAMMKDYWEKNDNFWGNLQLIITPIKGVVWTTNLSGTRHSYWNSKFNYNVFGGVPTNTQDFIKGTGLVGQKQFSYDQSGSRSYLLNSFVNYSKSIDKNDFGVMLGTEVSENENYAANGNAAYGIPAQDLRSSAVTPNRDGYNTWGNGSRYSQFGRITYSYDNRYLLTANFRNDATDKFAPGKRNAFFPSVSIGWNLANESFFSSGKINNLKFRVGIGKLGNASVPSNLWRQEYVLQSNGTWQAQKVVNRNVTWETTYSKNIGLDLGVWRNALTATIDYYNKETRNALLQIALPSTTGFGSYYVNKGTIQNRGLELSVGYQHGNKQFSYSVNGTMAYNKNTVLNLGNASYLDGGSHNRTYTGGPVSAFYGFVADGLYQTDSEIQALNTKAQANGFDSYDGNVAPGDIKFKDLNGDGTINEKDETSIGNPWPKIVYGFNVNLNYKGIDLVMNWQGVYGIDVYNELKQYTQSMFSDWNSTAAVKDAWSVSNTNSTIPRLGNSTHNYGKSSSYMIEDGSYLRLKNIQIGYNLSSQLLSKLKLRKLRIYTGIENALTITKFKGFDPEFMSGNNYSRGVYGLTQYPQYRSYVFGIQLGL
jgi:TonB-dependent starch-binding outer membrane protein SusC